MPGPLRPCPGPRTRELRPSVSSPAASRDSRRGVRPQEVAAEARVAVAPDALVAVAGARRDAQVALAPADGEAAARPGASEGADAAEGRRATREGRLVVAGAGGRAPQRPGPEESTRPGPATRASRKAHPPLPRPGPAPCGDLKGRPAPALLPAPDSVPHSYPEGPPAPPPPRTCPSRRPERSIRPGPRPASDPRLAQTARAHPPQSRPLPPPWSAVRRSGPLRGVRSPGGWKGGGPLRRHPVAHLAAGLRGVTSVLRPGRTPSTRRRRSG